MRTAHLFVSVFVFFLSTQALAAQDFFTRAELLKVSPKASPELVDALVANQAFLDEAGINSRLRVAHFLSQIMLETGGLRRLDENMNYSAKRLMQVFPSRVSAAQAARLDRKPREIANWVYGGRLGNRGQDTDDGWNYRGSGYIQLTGRSNFVNRGAEIGLPLAENPELARQPKEGLQAASGYWRARNVNAPADVNDRFRVRVLINGSRALGFHEGVAWFNKIWSQIYAGRQPFGEEAGWIQEEAATDTSDSFGIEEVLADRGLLTDTMVESSSPEDAYADALRAYQASRGLEETGTLNEETFYAITDPTEWRDAELETAAVEPSDPESGVSHRLASAGTAMEETIVLAPEEGSGETQDANLDSEESGMLAESDSAYAEYEVENGQQAPDGDFIPHTVIGDDDRVAVLSTQGFPARAIVQITFRKTPGSLRRGMCSGAMIAPDMVLTAGHCVHGGTAGGLWYSDFVVIPGRNTLLKPFGTCKAVATYALRGWTEAMSQFSASDFDLGAIRLDCPVGQKTGWFGVRALGDEERGGLTTIQGYSGDKAPQGRQWRSDDAMRDLRLLKGFYQNDTEGGTSGAPVFKDGEFSVFCVHTNGVMADAPPPWNANNACTRITGDRLSTIAGWLDN